MASNKNLPNKTIVCLTPLPMLEDSRVIKMAASFARWGYNSIVIESGLSTTNSPLPFKLISMGLPDVPLYRNRTLRAMWKVSTIKALAYALAVRVPVPLTSYASRNYKTNYLFHYRDKVRRVLPKADLYMLRSYLQYPAVQGKPFIYDASDFYSALWDKANRFESSWAMPFHQKIEYECTEKALAITTVSSGLAPLFFERFGRTPEIIRNCYDKRLDIPIEFTLKNMLGLTDSDFLAVVVGTAKDGMAISTALEALELLPHNVHIAFVGKKHQNYGSRTCSVGAVPANQVVPFISDADCILILYFDCNLNYRYCLPNSLFQGIAAQIPILYPMLPEIGNLAARYNLGLSIDPLDPSSIALAINELMAHKSKFGLEEAAAELSWEVEEQKLKKIVEGNL